MFSSRRPRWGAPTRPIPHRVTHRSGSRPLPACRVSGDREPGDRRVPRAGGPSCL